MNKKLAIFGFSILWITAIAAIVFILVPKLSSNKDFNAKKLQANELGIIEDDNSLFYDKKALVRHKNTDADSFNATKKAMVIRKNIFFTLPVKDRKSVV